MVKKTVVTTGSVALAGDGIVVCGVFRRIVGVWLTNTPIKSFMKISLVVVLLLLRLTRFPRNVEVEEFPSPECSAARAW